MKRIVALVLILAAFLLLAGCGGSAPEVDSSVGIAVTQTLEAMAQQSQVEATIVPQEEPQTEESALPADYPTKHACEQMAGWMTQSLGVQAVISLGVFDEPSGLNGNGCTVLSETDGSIWETWNDSLNSLHDQIKVNGWQEDPFFMAAGATGMATTYRSGEGVCQVLSEVGPVNRESCSNDAPIGECLSKLPPEEIFYKVRVDCSPDMMTNLSGMGPDFSTREIIVQFNPGETFQVLPGDLTQHNAIRFVLAAAEGQTMIISLTTEPEEMAVISVWGQDGMVYLSGLEGRPSWVMELPKDQNYYVDVKNIGDIDITYQIKFDIE